MPPRRTTGCQWRMRPNDFPPVSTVRGCLHAWRDDGLRDGMNRKLVEVARPAGIHGAGIQDRNGARDVLRPSGDGPCRSSNAPMGRRAHPCLTSDWEKSIASAEPWVTIAHIRRVRRQSIGGLSAFFPISSSIHGLAKP